MDTLTEDEFRKALFESLNKKGIVSSFKSHLRQQLAVQLSLKTKVCAHCSQQAGLLVSLKFGGDNVANIFIPRHTTSGPNIQ